jgi:hypothetical protein
MSAVSQNNTLPGTPFNFWMPASFSKGKDDNGNTVLKVGGIASDGTRDADKQILSPNTFDLTPFLTKGTLNWEHQSSKNPMAVIGEPTLAKVTDSNQLYIEGKLYKDNPIAKGVYDLMGILEKSSKTRRMGFSIEGYATEFDENDPSKVTKAVITDCALTMKPKNPNTLARVMKGEMGITEEEFIEKSEAANGGAVEYLVDIEMGGNHIMVTKTGQVSVKSLTTESGSALRVSTFNNRKKKLRKDQDELTKGGVYLRISKAFQDVTADQMDRIYDFILLKSKTSGMNKITDQTIDNAFESLGLKKGQETVTKTAYFQKGEGDLYRKLYKSEDGDGFVAADDRQYFKVGANEFMPASEEMVKGGTVPTFVAVEEKSQKETIALVKAENGGSEDTPADAKTPAVTAIEKGGDEPTTTPAATPAVDTSVLEKSLNNGIAALGVKINKGQTEATEQFQQMAVLLKGAFQKIERLEKAIEDFSSVPPVAKTVTRPQQVLQRFDQAPAIVKGGEAATDLHIQADKAQILEILDTKAFAKGGFDQVYGNAMNLYETTGVIPQEIIKGLAEEGINIVTAAPVQ